MPFLTTPLSATLFCFSKKIKNHHGFLTAAIGHQERQRQKKGRKQSQLSFFFITTRYSAAALLAAKVGITFSPNSLTERSASS